MSNLTPAAIARNPEPDQAALLRLINTGFKRFSSDPSSRVASTRLMLIAAASLHAAHADDFEIAQTIAQVLDAMGYGA